MIDAPALCRRPADGRADPLGAAGDQDDPAFQAAPFGTCRSTRLVQSSTVGTRVRTTPRHGLENARFAAAVPDADAQAHSARVVAHVRDEIARERRFHSARALHGARRSTRRALGYYVAGARKFGAAGDFVTGPELTPLYGAARRAAARGGRSRRRRRATSSSSAPAAVRSPPSVLERAGAARRAARRATGSSK